MRAPRPRRQVLGEMQAAGVAPTAVTYGCLLAACERLCQDPERSAWAVRRALELYREARAAPASPQQPPHACSAAARVQASRGREHQTRAAAAEPLSGALASSFP